MSLQQFKGEIESSKEIVDEIWRLSKRDAGVSVEKAQIIAFVFVGLSIAHGLIAVSHAVRKK